MSGPRRDVRAALVACHDDEGRWLLIRRSARVRAPLQVCFPGGTIEAHEPPRVAAVREMREELGAEIELGTLCLETFEATRGIHLFGFVARLRTSTLSPDPSEVSEILWLRDHEARRHPDALQPSTDLLLDALLHRPRS